MDKYSNDDSARQVSDLKMPEKHTNNKRPWIYMTDDEAYARKGQWLPDGLQSDGTEPRYCGKYQPESHDAAGFSSGSPIQHNNNGPDPAPEMPSTPEPSESEKADMSKTRGQIASSIQDPKERGRFVARQGELESAGKLDRKAMSDLSEENTRKQNYAAAMPVVDNQTQKIFR
jgi:hypothetical protein